jgi:alkylation response protein AidB-like acyl-CoA dehydrogenase
VKFQPTEQQELLNDTLGRYLREAYSLPQRAEILSSVEGFSREHWRFFAELGLLALPFSEADGGFGGSLQDVVQVARQFGAHLVVEPYIPCIVLAGRLLACSTDGDRRDHWLAPLMAGEALVGLAHLERGQRCGDPWGATRLTGRASGYRLTGTKLCVPAPHSLDTLLVTARDKDGALRVCVVPRTVAGITMRPYRTVDGHLLGEITFENVEIGRDEVVSLENADAALAEVIDYATACACGEVLGCMRAAVDLTLQYARDRKQFGRPIGSFQVIKHRLVDCDIQVQLAESMLDWACLSEEPQWPAYVAAAKALIGKYALAAGHEAIQIHGAIGLTDEYALSHYHKRIVMLNTLLGDPDVSTDRFIARTSGEGHGPGGLELPFQALLSEDEQAFRQDVRDFLAVALDARIAQATRRQTGTYPEKEMVISWQSILNEQGWLATHWPVEFGGTGWNPIERFLFEYQCAVAGAPEQVPMGLRYVGPVIAKFGSAWQKAHFLPRILSGEDYWAQGFSEPGAGSDLAAIKTTAVLDGAHYVVNGSKMWTTHAHFANWIFCIVRTEKAARPQEGVSFLLIDMNSPGITVNPIPLLAIDHEVNQVFFDNVRVPDSHLVGEAGRGWEYTKFLLEFERGGGVFCGRMRWELSLLRELIDGTNPDLWNDRMIAHRLAELEFRLMALELFELRQISAMQVGNAPGVGGSISKLLGSELQMDITETSMHVSGIAGMEMESQRPLPNPESIGFSGIDLELVAVPRYLNLRAASIYGGSSEIQREIIAKHLLDLR